MVGVGLEGSFLTVVPAPVSSSQTANDVTGHKTDSVNMADLHHHGGLYSPPVSQHQPFLTGILVKCLVIATWIITNIRSTHGLRRMLRAQ